MAETDPSFVLTLACPNRPGIVAALSGCLFDLGCDITDAQQFDDPVTGRFFMRVVFAAPAPVSDEAVIRSRVEPIAARFGMEWRVRDRRRPYRVLILVSRFDHCLVDLLYRRSIGEMAMDITGIVSNHPRETFGSIDFQSAPFSYLPTSSATKADQEAHLWSLIEETRTELVVLARYMQVLSDDLSRRLSGRCINIHHSFLPGFKGARPYHQAFERGVKLIGATAHYVTGDLDEGPIIEQDVERINHRHSTDDLVRKGRDVERRVLASAVRSHIADRVILNGTKTVVFKS